MSDHTTGNPVIDDLIAKAAAGDSNAAATVALTHATLALVEQQRIANLIALRAVIVSPPLELSKLSNIQIETMLDIESQVNDGLGL